MNAIKFNSRFADQVARLCFDKFDNLPKSGKPVNGEWTLLAAIVKHCDNTLEVVSIATGSKCLGGTKLSPEGTVINDSHAEVLARRGFLRYLYEQIELTESNLKGTIFTKSENEGKYILHSSINFHLFSSHVPCGDASIFPKIVKPKTDHVSASSVATNSFGKRCTKNYNSSLKKQKLSNDAPINIDVGTVIQDIYRTGAKCLPECEKQDKKLTGANYHVLGVVRTKPGRGDPTLSVSCSDKILRWNCVGIQGALLSLLVDPIYLSSIIISGHESLYSKDALHRAVIERNVAVTKMVTRPALLHSNTEFKFCRRLCGNSTKSSPCGVVWCNVLSKNHEVCVEGRRLGWTKKVSSKIQPLFVSKKMLFRSFKSLTKGKYDELTYFEVKSKATAYQEMWTKFKIAIELWPQKEIDLIQFR